MANKQLYPFNKEQLQLIYLAAEHFKNDPKYSNLVKYLNKLLGIEGLGDRREFLTSKRH